MNTLNFALHWFELRYECLDMKTACKNDNENTGMILLQVAAYSLGKLLVRRQTSNNTNYVNNRQQLYFNSEKNYW
jgi:hypothetical protein